MTNLEKILLQKNVSCNSLAKKMNVAPSTVLRRKKHGIKNISTAKKYSKALDVKPQLLIEL
ncbi:helix-turn-helix domain-containing protein [Lentisphaerota bacterium WC36G]|nr:helix-turn-helix transcriptional regulator [Lentisphaerae bacterium WC36]